MEFAAGSLFAVRISTHPRIYARQRPEDALAFARLLLEQPIAT